MLLRKIFMMISANHAAKLNLESSSAPYLPYIKRASLSLNLFMLSFAPLKYLSVHESRAVEHP